VNLAGVGIFLLGKTAIKEARARKIEFTTKILVRDFSCSVLSDRAVVSLDIKFNNRYSPRDKT